MFFNEEYSSSGKAASEHRRPSVYEYVAEKRSAANAARWGIGEKSGAPKNCLSAKPMIFGERSNREAGEAIQLAWVA